MSASSPAGWARLWPHPHREQPHLIAVKRRAQRPAAFVPRSGYPATALNTPPLTPPKHATGLRTDCWRDHARGDVTSAQWVSRTKGASSPWWFVDFFFFSFFFCCSRSFDCRKPKPAPKKHTRPDFTLRKTRPMGSFGCLSPPLPTLGRRFQAVLHPVVSQRNPPISSRPCRDERALGFGAASCAGIVCALHCRHCHTDCRVQLRHRRRCRITSH
jgi:hypothetical protein